MTVLLGTVEGSWSEEWSAESKRKYLWMWRMSGLTMDGTAEPKSRDQTLMRERGKYAIFPIQLTTGRIDNDTRLMPCLLEVMTTHTRYRQVQLIPKPKISFRNMSNSKSTTQDDSDLLHCVA